MCEDVKGRERIKNCSGLEKTRKKKGWGRGASGDNPEPERKKKDTSGTAREV